MKRCRLLLVEVGESPSSAGGPGCSDGRRYLSSRRLFDVLSASQWLALSALEFALARVPTPFNAVAAAGMPYWSLSAYLKHGSTAVNLRRFEAALLRGPPSRRQWVSSAYHLPPCGKSANRLCQHRRLGRKPHGGAETEEGVFEIIRGRSRTRAGHPAPALRSSRLPPMLVLVATDAWHPQVNVGA